MNFGKYCVCRFWSSSFCLFLDLSVSLYFVPLSWPFCQSLLCASLLTFLSVSPLCLSLDLSVSLSFVPLSWPFCQSLFCASLLTFLSVSPLCLSLDISVKSLLCASLLTFLSVSPLCLSSLWLDKSRRKKNCLQTNFT